MNTLLRFAALLLLVMSVSITCKQTSSNVNPELLTPTITSLSPFGLIPGGPLSLTGTNFSNVTDIEFIDEQGKSTGKVYAQNFLQMGELLISAGYITAKVPLGVSASQVRINNEYGNGKPQSISKSSGTEALTTQSVATGVTSVASSSITNECINCSINSNSCVTKSFFYCIPLPDNSRFPYGTSGGATVSALYNLTIATGSRLVLGFKHSASDNQPTGYSCDKMNIYYATQLLGDSQWHVFTGLYPSGTGGVPSNSPVITLKLARNTRNTEYTGSAIIEMNNYSSGKTTYIGSLLKNGDIYAYSVATGKEIHLCKKSGFSASSKILTDCLACN